VLAKAAASCDASGDATAQRAAIVERARGLREQAWRVMADNDPVAVATEDDIRDYLREQPPQVREDLLRRSPYARLVARLETLPTIEQAKGILMAQHRCGPDEAFDTLRKASQRCNVPIRELAARLVAETAHPTSHQEAAPDGFRTACDDAAGRDSRTPRSLGSIPRSGIISARRSARMRSTVAPAALQTEV
jgi:hypothetical protein